MKITKHLTLPILAMAVLVGTQSCKKDEIEPVTPTPAPAAMESTYNYEFNNGQVIPTAAYNGAHMDNVEATIKVTELTSSTSRITVSLTNTISGETYHTHAHDAADPTTTPNNTPYNETPNSAVYAQMIMGNGGTVSMSQDVSMSYSAITSTYNGFFVVHDPLQGVTTTDISTYLFVGSFARTQAATNFGSTVFPYDFNTGQVAAAYAYNGTHATSLTGDLKIQELGDGTSRVTAMMNNSLNGETYNVHAHDAADPSTTPNNTPYDETPNTGLCAMTITGNGGTAGNSQMTAMSYADITATYEGFFVVHDPLQAVTTTDPTTYVILGLFARN